MADDTSEDEREEELNTLESIYPELIRDPSNPYTAQLDLNVAPITPLAVTFDPEQTVYQLSHLPPLHLEITLPEGYPETLPLSVKLTTTPPWLPDSVLEKLISDGAVLWEEYGHMQVLYAYVSQLQEAAETAFGLADNSADGPLKLPSPLKTVILDLNNQIKRETFEKETFDCGVCLEPKKGAVCYRLERCSHVFCQGCLQDFYNNCIKEGDVDNVKCLDPSCGKTGNTAIDRRKKPRILSPKELLQIPLTLETVQRFAELKRKKKIEADKSIAFCPRSWCQGAMRTEKYPKITDVSQMDDSEEEETEDVVPANEEEVPSTGIEKRPMGRTGMDRLVICEDCNLAFCKTCLACWHGDYMICQPRQPADLTEDDQASLNFILRNTSPCPECSVPCQKSYGCNHMTCFQCKTHFCYLCGAWLNSSNPYAHFNDKKNKGCYQRLMDMAEGDGGGDAQFGGRRGAENLADFYEQEAMRIQMEEDERTEGAH